MDSVAGLIGLLLLFTLAQTIFGNPNLQSAKFLAVFETIDCGAGVLSYSVAGDGTDMIVLTPDADLPHDASCTFTVDMTQPICNGKTGVSLL